MSIERVSLAGPTPSLDVHLLFVRYNRMIRWEIQGMKAPFWRFYLPFDPGGALQFEEKTIPLIPGEGIFIAPQTDCATSASGEFRKVFCHFEIDAAPMLSVPGIYRTSILPQAWQRLQKYFESPFESNREQLLNLNLMMMERIVAGIIQLSNQAFQRAQVLPLPLQLAIARMQAAKGGPLCNIKLSQESGMHVNSFIRLFSQYLHMSPQKYYLRLRLESAARDLVTNGKTIEAIANLYCFWDRNHFTRLFTRQFGISPARYRDMNRQ